MSYNSKGNPKNGTTPVTITADWTVNEVVGAYPTTLPVFGRYGIDSCCGGLKSLGEVAVIHHLPLDQLLTDLTRAISPLGGANRA